MVSEGFLPIQHLEVYDPNGPNVDFSRYVGLLLCYKTLRRQVPIGANTLGSKLDDVLIGGLAEPKISDLDLALVKHDVLGF